MQALDLTSIMLPSTQLTASSRDDLNVLGKIFIRAPLGRKGSGFRPDWTTDYDGTEQLWWIYEDGFVEDGPERNSLVCDPGTACGFEELLANPPLESAADMSPRTQLPDDGSDIFSRVTEDILNTPSLCISARFADRFEKSGIRPPELELLAF